MLKIYGDCLTRNFNSFFNRPSNLKYKKRQQNSLDITMLSFIIRNLSYI